MIPTDSDRINALELLTRFQRHVLPGALRRIAIWKGIEIRLLTDSLEDLHQELAVDCLEHTEKILQLTPRERHARWLRLVDRVIYRLRQQLGRQRTLHYEPYFVPMRDPSPHEPPPQIPKLIALNNGRLNAVASLRNSGLPRRSLRKQLNQLSEHLGWNRERERFWQARVVEALTGLAADLLRERQSVLLLDRTRARPDSNKRLERLRQLSVRFPVQPSTLEVRRVLRPWHGRCPPVRWDPRHLLEQAVALDPDAAAAWLWLFEACCADDDHLGATRAVRNARRCPTGSRAATVLSRARLLELRGRLPAGLRLLERAARRWPHKPTLQRARLAALNEASG